MDRESIDARAASVADSGSSVPSAGSSAHASPTLGYAEYFRRRGHGASPYEVAAPRFKQSAEASFTKLDQIGVRDILVHMSNGSSTQIIADQVGVSPFDLSKWIDTRVDSDDLARARALGAEARLETARAYVMLGDPQNAQETAMVKELMRDAQWDATRRASTVYGDKGVSKTAAVQINFDLGHMHECAEAAVVVDMEADTIKPSSNITTLDAMAEFGFGKEGNE